MIRRAKRYLDERGMPTDAMLRSVLAEHVRNLPRLGMLRNYYLGNSPIMSRVRAKGLPNNRIAHPIARYIVSVATGYLAGQPVAYAIDGEQEQASLDPITEMYARCAISSVDAENARNASIYGRAVEYVHVQAVEGDATQVRACAASLPPEQAFVVYDDDYHFTPLFGVYYIQDTKEDGSPDGYRLWISGAKLIRECKIGDLGAASIHEIAVTDHFFGDVPMVEYWNDDQERGDFESVISLIDAYDKLESDRVNDKEQEVDKLLLLTGCTMETDERGREPWQQLREDKALCLPDTQAQASYLDGASASSEDEIMRGALIADIHKMSMVPDLSDKDFANNVSGVAMRYKLWGLEQLTNVKQQWFMEGLRARLKLFAHFTEVKGFPQLDVDNVKITMTRALPANNLEYAQLAQTADAAGAASTETKVRMLHAADNWTDEMVQAEVERIRGDASMPDMNALLNAAGPGEGIE